MAAMMALLAVSIADPHVTGDHPGVTALDLCHGQFDPDSTHTTASSWSWRIVGRS